jgi:hypothetical protein
MKSRRVAAIGLVFVLSVAGSVSARPDRPDAKKASGPAAVTVPAAGRAASILGTAWTAENTPIQFARLQLRNVVSGRVEARAQANEAGQFTFDSVESGSYAVELLNDAGKVLVVGHVFTIAPGETVATFVRLGTKVPWVANFFTNSVSAVSATAASEGITALAPVVRPVSGKN